MSIQEVVSEYDRLKTKLSQIVGEIIPCCQKYEKAKEKYETFSKPSHSWKETAYAQVVTSVLEKLPKELKATLVRSSVNVFRSFAVQIGNIATTAAPLTDKDSFEWWGRSNDAKSAGFLRFMNVMLLILAIPACIVPVVMFFTGHIFLALAIFAGALVIIYFAAKGMTNTHTSLNDKAMKNAVQTGAIDIEDAKELMDRESFSKAVVLWQKEFCPIYLRLLELVERYDSELPPNINEVMSKLKEFNDYISVYYAQQMPADVQAELDRRLDAVERQEEATQAFESEILLKIFAGVAKTVCVAGAVGAIVWKMTPSGVAGNILDGGGWQYKHPDGAWRDYAP